MPPRQHPPTPEAIARSHEYRKGADQVQIAEDGVASVYRNYFESKGLVKSFYGQDPKFSWIFLEAKLNI